MNRQISSEYQATVQSLKKTAASFEDKVRKYELERAEVQKQSKVLEVYLLNKCIQFLNEVIQIESTGEVASKAVGLQEKLIKFKFTAKISESELAQLDTSNLLLHSKFLEQVQEKVNNWNDSKNKNDRYFKYFIESIGPNELQNIDSNNKLKRTEISMLELQYTFSTSFKNLYFKVVDFAKAYYTQKLTAVINPSASNEFKFNDEPDLEEKPTQQSIANTPGLTLFNQIPKTSSSEIDWDKDVNECDEEEISLRFAAHYAVQCDKEFFVWPFSTMYRKVKNNEPITVQEIKAHALSDRKSRTAQVVQEMGLKLY